MCSNPQQWRLQGAGKFQFILFQLTLGLYSPYLQEGAGNIFLQLKTDITSNKYAVIGRRRSAMSWNRLQCEDNYYTADRLTHPKSRNTHAFGPGERGGRNSLLIILSQKHFLPKHKNVCSGMRVINRRKFTVSEKNWSNNSSCTHSTSHTNFNVTQGHFEDSHEIFCTSVIFILRIQVPIEMKPSVITERVWDGYCELQSFNCMQ